MFSMAKWGYDLELKFVMLLLSYLNSVEATIYHFLV